MVGEVVEEANPTKSRWREWLLSSSPRGKLVAVRRKVGARAQVVLWERVWSELGG